LVDVETAASSSNQPTLHMAPKVTSAPKSVQTTINFKSTKPSAVQASKAKKETEVKSQPSTTTVTKPVSPARPKRNVKPIAVESDDDDDVEDLDAYDSSATSSDEDEIDEVQPSTKVEERQETVNAAKIEDIKEPIAISSSEDDEKLATKGEEGEKLEDLSRTKSFKHELAPSKEKIGGKPVGTFGPTHAS
jgi:hypothetical protein